MDTMYEFFYLTVLVAVILLGITTLVLPTIRRRNAKVAGYVFCSLVVIIAVAFIGFAVTLPWGS